MQGSPRHPPPDSPLPQIPNARPIHPPVFPSKFHEHFSSVSSTGHTSPALRSTSESGSSSGPSVRSMRSSNAPSVSTSDSHSHSSRHSGGVVDTRTGTRVPCSQSSATGSRSRPALLTHTRIRPCSIRGATSVSVSTMNVRARTTRRGEMIQECTD
ncbi:hypothetical protein BDR07DRAFT_71271 [Suillus spraguei]|nr:hypothetical protein BDR07DRAFT_71271 [Suillus spraguei]